MKGLFDGYALHFVRCTTDYYFEQSDGNETTTRFIYLGQVFCVRFMSDLPGNYDRRFDDFFEIVFP